VKKDSSAIQMICDRKKRESMTKIIRLFSEEEIESLTKNKKGLHQLEAQVLQLTRGIQHLHQKDVIEFLQKIDQYPEN
jgi:hypothetical protein